MRTKMTLAQEIFDRLEAMAADHVPDQCPRSSGLSCFCEEKEETSKHESDSIKA